jgi:hypothetical protein
MIKLFSVTLCPQKSSTIFIETQVNTQPSERKCKMSGNQSKITRHGQGGEMNQALYAHMNNKRKMKKKITRPVKSVS